MRRRIPTLTPAAYQRVAEVALGALTLIVFTGAAVRLTGSGLGCPDWPKCYGGVAPPLETHAWVEYGNRLISGFVGLAAVAAGVGVWGAGAVRRAPRAAAAVPPRPRPVRRAAAAGRREPGRARRLHGPQPSRPRLRHGPLRALHARALRRGDAGVARASRAGRAPTRAGPRERVGGAGAA